MTRETFDKVLEIQKNIEFWEQRKFFYGSIDKGALMKAHLVQLMTYRNMLNDEQEEKVAKLFRECILMNIEDIDNEIEKLNNEIKNL